MRLRRCLPLWAAGCLIGAVSAQDATQRRGFSIEITEPQNQAIVLGKTRIAAEVEIGDPGFVDRVEFFVGDELIFVDREPPWEAVHDFEEESRAWVIRAVAHHKEEVTVSDAVITRQIGFVTVERVNRVILWLSATDKKGNLLTELDRADFAVFENDAEQEILEFYNETRPITMAILIDSSSSMRESLDEVHEAASAFVETLREEDRAMVIDFDDKVFMIQDLTSDHEALKEAITSIEGLGGTAIYDVLHAAYRKIGKIEGRKVIILLSDGEDTFSQFSYERVLEEAKSNNTMIFTVSIGTSRFNKSVPKSFADATGGRSFVVKKAEDLGDVYRRIADELRTQYYLEYSTANEEWDGRWMEIRVESKQPGVDVRSRSGYFAVRQVFEGERVGGQPSLSRSASNPGGGIGCSGGISSSGDGS